MNYIAYIAAITAWVFGIAFAKGFWQTTAAYVFPPYAWVLVAESVIDRTCALPEPPV